MCGIAGILLLTPRSLIEGDERARAMFRPHAEAIPEQWLDSLEASIAHRGPDGRGRFRDRAVAPDGTIVDVALVHRRLSIIDHACGGQPMVTLRQRKPWETPDYSLAPPEPTAESVPVSVFIGQGAPSDEPRYAALRVDRDQALRATVFNGCIYNHAAIRAELQSLGAKFATDHSDTEVIPHALQQWGVGALYRLDGMFALAVWDRDQASLTISCDSFGEKPLYVTEARLSDGRVRVVFASTAAAVLPFVTSRPAPGEPEIDGGAEVRAARNWLRFGFAHGSPDRRLNSEIPGTAVVWKGLEANRFGHHGLTQAMIDESYLFGYSEHITAQIHFPVRCHALNIPRTLELLESAVRSRLVADVPVACFLSGGVDSSVIAALAARDVASLQTVNVKMPDAAIDESVHARAVAKHLGTRHTEIDAGSDLIGDPAADLTMLIAQSGVPLGDSSLLASLWVSRAASRVAKVALGGDGGDELFAGYERYRAAAMFHRAGPLRYAGLIAGAWPPAGADARGLRRWRALNAAAHDGYADLLAIFPRTMIDELWPVSRCWHRDARKRYDTGPVPADRPGLLPLPDGAGAIERAISSDVWSYLPDDLLRKVDTASMSMPLEVRSPMLARALSDAAMRAPIRDLYLNHERKGLLRAVARTLVPASVIDRPKQGFASPISSWLRTDVAGLRTLARERLLSPGAFAGIAAHGQVREPVIRRLLDEHSAGTHDHAQRIYALLVFSLWGSWRQTVRPIGE